MDEEKKLAFEWKFPPSTRGKSLCLYFSNLRWQHSIPLGAYPGLKKHTRHKFSHTTDFQVYNAVVGWHFRRRLAEE